MFGRSILAPTLWVTGRFIMTTGSFPSFSRKAPLALAAALMIALAGSITTADARIGGGGSFGSRGSRTFSMPSATPTAPRTAPFTRSATPNYGQSTGGVSRPGFFGGGGFGRGLLGGFLGAGLFGMLFGGGFGGGLGGGMSIIGLLLQLALLFFAVRFIMSFFRSRQQPAFGGGGAAPGGFGGFFGGQNGNANAGAPRGPQGTPITIGPQDYAAFEQRLVESQAAYSNGDLAVLRRISTREMSDNFEQELAGNDRQGVVNKISDVRLLSGDLSEAWREGTTEYATVAMRFSLIDTTLDKRTGNVVDGDARSPQTVTETWTFTRSSGSSPDAWVLSGIQQV